MPSRCLPELGICERANSDRFQRAGLCGKPDRLAQGLLDVRCGPRSDGRRDRRLRGDALEHQSAPASGDPGVQGRRALAEHEPSKRYILDFEQTIYAGATNLNYLQLIWAANTLNNGYYGWRSGKLTEFEAPDGTIIRPDPWLNAGTVALQYFFSRTESGEQYDTSVGPSGFIETYVRLFGDPFAEDAASDTGQSAATPAQPALSLAADLDLHGGSTHRLGKW